MSLFEVVHETEHLIVIDKAPGVSFHRENESPGLVETVRSQLSLQELYPVHRLDRVTSGLMILGRTREAARELAKAIRTRSFDKYYLALSSGKPRKKQGLILGDMAKSRRGTWKLLRSRNHPAATQFMSRSVGEKLRLFLLRPLTGRTHQLRVAMKSLGTPVLGDPRYERFGPGSENHDRTYLHAFAVRFQLQGEVHAFVRAPGVGRLFLRHDVQEGVHGYGRPWELPWPRLAV